MIKEVNGPGTKTAEVLWQHASISIGAEVKMPQRPLESKNTNSLPARLKRLTKGGKKGHVITSPCPAPPSIHLHAHKNGGRMDPPNFTEAWDNPPFSPFIPGKSLWILIALLGRRLGAGRGGGGRVQTWRRRNRNGIQI